jgi:hypothetical protein
MITRHFLPLDAIHTSHEYVEKTVQSMASSMRRKGLKHPLIVTRRGNEWRLLIGAKVWTKNHNLILQHCTMMVKGSSNYP